MYAPFYLTEVPIHSGNRSMNMKKPRWVSKQNFDARILSRFECHRLPNACHQITYLNVADSATTKVALREKETKVDDTFVVRLQKLHPLLLRDCVERSRQSIANHAGVNLLLVQKPQFRSQPFNPQSSCESCWYVPVFHVHIGSCLAYRIIDLS